MQEKTILLAYESAEKMLNKLRQQFRYPQFEFLVCKPDTPDILAYPADLIIYTDSHIGIDTQAALKTYLEEVPEEISKYYLLDQSNIRQSDVKAIIEDL